jgi:hypothetical protein
MIRLRYPAVCASCGGELAPGAQALWDRGTRTATCAACSGGQAEALVAPSKPLERGSAGGSAARRYEHLHERREARARERFGHLSGLYLGLTHDPQSTRAWEIGSSGERKLGAYLDTLDDDRTLFVFHDRRLPGTCANIDHIAVTRGGVFAIDAKNYTDIHRRRRLHERPTPRLRPALLRCKASCHRHRR